MIKRIILLIMILMVVLTGCGSDSYANRPNEIRKEIWNASGDLFYALIDESKQKVDMQTTDAYIEKFEKIYSKYLEADEDIVKSVEKNNVTVEEFDLLMTTKLMIIARNGIKSARNSYPVNVNMLIEYSSKFNETKNELLKYFPLNQQ